tara:strand:- start:486 stop:695 length:210 start_codon:yes stop_codon:yes gene_type:complete
MTLPKDIKIIIDRLTREAACGSQIGIEWMEAVQTEDKAAISRLMIEVNKMLYDWRKKDIPNQIEKLIKQ